MDNRAMIQAALSAGVKCELNLESTLRFVEFDESQFMQVMLNLAVNARDAMPAGGEFFISTAAVSLDADFFAARSIGPKPGDYLYLTIRDTGMGIQKELISRIFDPYFSTKTRDKGTGLGLSVAYGIIKQHGGYLFCDSEVGLGTRFEIFLPATNAASVIAPAESDTIVQSHLIDAIFPSITILLVDDETQLRELLRSQLQQSGFQVFTAANGLDTLRFIDSYAGSIDIIVTDIMMPEMNGLEMADEACLLQPDASCIFISGYSRDLLEERPLPNQSRLLIKPFTKTALLAEIRSVLREKGRTEMPDSAVSN